MFTTNYTLTKRDILLRLFNDGHISAEELLILSEGTIVQYFPLPSQEPISPYIPTPFPTYPEWPITYTNCSMSHSFNHN